MEVLKHFVPKSDVKDFKLYVHWNNIYLKEEYEVSGGLSLSMVVSQDMKESVLRGDYIGFKPTNKMKALEILQEKIYEKELECYDNFRATKVGDPIGEKEYEQAINEGCCGFFDTEVEINGELWKIGCNHGH